MARHQAEKTNCPSGHPYDEPNTYITKDHKRMCRACARARGRVVHATVAEMFWRSFERDPATGCWIWQLKPLNTGYGYMRSKRYGVAMTAHRFAYELLVAPVPPELVVDHLCRNRLCVNPVHLEPVTYSENALRGYAALRLERAAA